MAISPILARSILERLVYNAFNLRFLDDKPELIKIGRDGTQYPNYSDTLECMFEHEVIGKTILFKNDFGKIGGRIVQVINLDESNKNSDISKLFNQIKQTYIDLSTKAHPPNFIPKHAIDFDSTGLNKMEVEMIKALIYIYGDKNEIDFNIL